MDIHLPQNLVDDLFHQHEEERDRIRAGIPSSMPQSQKLYRQTTKRRQYGKRFKLLKF